MHIFIYSERYEVLTKFPSHLFSFFIHTLMSPVHACYMHAGVHATLVHACVCVHVCV